MGNAQTLIDPSSAQSQSMKQITYFSALVPAIVIIIAGLVIRLSDLRFSAGFLSVSIILLTMILSLLIYSPNPLPHKYLQFIIIAIIGILCVIVAEDIFKIKNGITHGELFVTTSTSSSSSCTCKKSKRSTKKNRFR